MRLFIISILTTVSLCTVAAFANANDSHHHSVYAGQETRSIKSLSAEDIAELKAGSGWGLAKTAELNGVPGPKHLLELKDEIDLSENQIADIEELFDEMNTAAVTLGLSLIEKEQQLEARFKTDLPDEHELKSLLDEISETRSALRFVHLAAHLKTPDILSNQQIDTYNNLRGYASADPCEYIPEGHNREMWKRHNNCN